MEFKFSKAFLFSMLNLVVIGGMLAGCAANTPVAPTIAAKVEPTATSAPTAIPTEAPKPVAKYVFLFIGDGMGVAQRNAAEIYLAATKKADARPEDTKLIMNTLPAQGMTTTYDLSSIITDSASAGTALATGHKTISGTINMDPAFKEKYTTIAEIAKTKGMKVGIVSNVSLDHATPASFYSHVSSRSKYYDIAVEMGKSNFDYFAGGGFLEPKGKEKDKEDVLDLAKANGYTVVNSRENFDKLAAGAGKTIFVNEILQDSQSLNYDMDRPNGDVSLAELTKKGIDLLDNPNGFFFMVEGGKIDWACHANDAAASIKDTIALDAAIAEALKFYENHKEETLIIVTGDHETGGLTIGFAGTGYSNYINKIDSQKGSYVAFNSKFNEFKKANEKAEFEDIIPLIKEYYGLEVITSDERAQLSDAVKKAGEKEATDADKAAGKEAKAKLSVSFTESELQTVKDAFSASLLSSDDRKHIVDVDLLYGGYEPLTIKLTTILDHKAGLGWTSYSHTGVPIQTSAIGFGSEQFNGYYDNTNIYEKMMTLAGLE